MTAPVKLRVTLPRQRFWEGERLAARISIATATDAPSVRVPLPFDPSRREVEVAIRRDGEAMPYEWTGDGAAADGEVAPGSCFVSELSFGEDLSRGAYEATVRWAPNGGTALEDTIRFEVVAVTETASSPDGPFAALGILNGSGFGAIVEQTYSPHPEDGGLLVRALNATRYVGRLPVRGTARTAAPSPWIAGWNEEGVFARSGGEVEDVARVGWPGGEPLSMISAAHETESGGLRLFALGDGALHAYDFDPPRAEVQEAEGPDDWDDEVLVPGDARQRRLGELEGARAATVVLERGDPRIVARTESGLLIAPVELDRLGPVSRVELPGEHVAAAPVAWADRSIEVAALVGRETPDAQGGRDLGIARVVVDDVPAIDVVWLGRLPSAAVAATLAVAPDEQGAPLAVAAVACEDGTLCVGDTTGRWTLTDAPEGLLVPLAVTAAAGRIHVGVETPRGPTLRRLEPALVGGT